LRCFQGMQSLCVSSVTTLIVHDSDDREAFAIVKQISVQWLAYFDYVVVDHGEAREDKPDWMCLLHANIDSSVSSSR
jgi:hypothetical protein